MPRLQTCLLFARAAILLNFAAVATAETAATTVPPNIQGWYHPPIAADTWSPVGCSDDKIYATSDGYGKCCPTPTSDCSGFVTDCSGETQYFDNGASVECATGSYCQTMTIFDAATTELSSVLDIFCWTSWSASTVFRHPATSTGGGSLDTSITPGPSVTNSLAAATATNAGPQDSNSDSDSGNRAWIAGAVIGPVAGCAIIAVLGFWLFRRGAKMGRETAVAETAYYVPQPQPEYVPAPVQEYIAQKDDDRTRSELPAS